MGDGTPSHYYVLGSCQLKPLTLVSDNTEQTILKADKINIVNEGGEPYTLGGDRVPSHYSHQKIWGKYQWVGIEKGFDGA